MFLLIFFCFVTEQKLVKQSVVEWHFLKYGIKNGLLVLFSIVKMPFLMETGGNFWTGGVRGLKSSCAVSSRFIHCTFSRSLCQGVHDIQENNIPVVTD